MTSHYSGQLVHAYGGGFKLAKQRLRCSSLEERYLRSDKADN